MKLALILLGLVCGFLGGHSAPQAAYWLPNVEHGISAYNYDPGSYKVFRNVRDYGAKGDGVTDDSDAINLATSDGHRCGEGCGSSTRSPGIVYFPSGTYLIKKPLIQFYYTQYIGDATNRPTLVMDPNWAGGIGMIESDVYYSGGASWWVPQSNFYRQIRNLVIDLTRVDAKKSATAIHWQVAQATSITNVHVKMSRAAGNNHQGIWMENGSGGYLSDLSFDGGKYAMWVGNQQFTTNRVKITNAQTGIFIHWNWGWTFKSVTFENCGTAVDITNGGHEKENVGSVILLDSEIVNTKVGVRTATDSSSKPHSSGTVVLDNVEFRNVEKGVLHQNGHVHLEGGTRKVDLYVQGQVYERSMAHRYQQGTLARAQRPAALLGNNGKYFEREKLLYLDKSAADFVSVKAEGAKGDGKSDATAALRATLAKHAGKKIVYFPAGTYLVSDTVLVPVGSRLVGEVWSTISATGQNFKDYNNPRPVFKLGNPGDKGVIELSEFIFTTHGPAAGAILVQVNAKDDQKGSVALFDVHMRVGGAAGTDLGDATCRKETQISRPECFGAFLLLHVTKTGSLYTENLWAWTADHDLDGSAQVSVYTGRGVLIESQEGPVWLYGTASEHNVFYQYQVAGAKNVLMAMIQTETPYYQNRPPAPQPFKVNTVFRDPDFSKCPQGSRTCPAAWGLRVVDSQDVFVYGAGLYNFFLAYDQGCLNGEHCQDSMVSIENSSQNVNLFNLNTKAADNMLVANGNKFVKQADNRNTFCSTIAKYPL